MRFQYDWDAAEYRRVIWIGSLRSRGGWLTALFTGAIVIFTAVQVYAVITALLQRNVLASALAFPLALLGTIALASILWQPYAAARRYRSVRKGRATCVPRPGGKYRRFPALVASQPRRR